MCKGILISIVTMGIFFSFNSDKLKMKEGYYLSTHNHASILYKIDSKKIEWYLDNEIKKRGVGQYEIHLIDSTIKISYDKIWKSTQPNLLANNEVYLKIKWDKSTNSFELSEYI